MRTKVRSLCFTPHCFGGVFGLLHCITFGSRGVREGWKMGKYDGVKLDSVTRTAKVEKKKIHKQK